MDVYGKCGDQDDHGEGLDLLNSYQVSTEDVNVTSNNVLMLGCI